MFQEHFQPPECWQKRTFPKTALQFSFNNFFKSLIIITLIIAPLKNLTILRLELMSACIIATLMDTVQAALSPHIMIEDKFYWLDSKTALYWIYNAKDWKQFVQPRVNEILGLSVKSQWRYCPGLDNPAEVLMLVS